MSHNVKYYLKSDIATVDFSCASLSSKSKKGQCYRGRQTYCLFLGKLFLLIKGIFVKFCFSEIHVSEWKIC